MTGSMLFPSKGEILQILQALPCPELLMLSHLIWQYQSAHSANKLFWAVTLEHAQISDH